MIVSASEQVRAEAPSFTEVVRGRHSVRSYDKSVRLSHEEIKEILAEAALAPSSSNMQPWRFLVIETEELKAKLQPIANNQSQVSEAAAVIVVLGDREGYLKANEIYEETMKQGFMPEDIAKSFAERSIALYGSLPQERLDRIVYIDGGLVSQQLMLVARAHGYDTVPMGGYDEALLKEAFNISDRYLPVMLIALGKAAKPGRPTTRLPIEDLAFFNEMPAK
ncbi:nitroreductase family protein [Gorillibacterium massiliense]|uniref:nitroreductase family protein n=1 Tax=Gorillibacterium massiliense TaxID=1280390 RepID=UPI0004B0807A|nr:nitroreductase family protein [Gorillibacterium massiliense]